MGGCPAGYPYRSGFSYLCYSCDSVVVTSLSGVVNNCVQFNPQYILYNNNTATGEIYDYCINCSNCCILCSAGYILKNGQCLTCS